MRRAGRAARAILVVGGALVLLVAVPYLEVERKGAETTRLTAPVRVSDNLVEWRVMTGASQDVRCWTSERGRTLWPNARHVVRLPVQGLGEQLSWLNVACSDESVARLARGVHPVAGIRTPVEIARIRISTREMGEVIKFWAAEATNGALDAAQGVTLVRQNDRAEGGDGRWYQYQVTRTSESHTPDDFDVSFEETGVEVELESKRRPLYVFGYMREIKCGDDCYGGEDADDTTFADAVVKYRRNRDVRRGKFVTDSVSGKSYQNVGKVFWFELFDGKGVATVQFMNRSPRHARVGARAGATIDWQYKDGARGFRPWGRRHDWLWKDSVELAFAEAVTDGDEGVKQRLANLVAGEFAKLQRSAYPWIVDYIADQSKIIRSVTRTRSYRKYVPNLNVGCGRVLDRRKSIEFSVFRDSVLDCSREGYEIPRLSLGRSGSAVNIEVSYEFINRMLAIAFDRPARLLLDNLIDEAAWLRENSRGALRPALRDVHEKLINFRLALACFHSDRECPEDAEKVVDNVRDLLAVLGVEFDADLRFHVPLRVRPHSETEVAVFFDQSDVVLPLGLAKGLLRTPLSIEGKFGLGGGGRNAGDYLREHLVVEPEWSRGHGNVDRTIMERYQALSGLVVEILGGGGERWMVMLQEDKGRELKRTIRNVTEVVDHTVTVIDQYFAARPTLDLDDNISVSFDRVSNDMDEYSLQLRLGVATSR